MEKPNLDLYLAAPRGFCAGVDRAIKIVEMALEKWGAPVFVRHEIVHNKYVVDELRSKGAIFVETLEECPSDKASYFFLLMGFQNLFQLQQMLAKCFLLMPLAHLSAKYTLKLNDTIQMGFKW